MNVRLCLLAGPQSFATSYRFHKPIRYRTCRLARDRLTAHPLARGWRELPCEPANQARGLAESVSLSCVEKDPVYAFLIAGLLFECLFPADRCTTAHNVGAVDAGTQAGQQYCGQKSQAQRGQWLPQGHVFGQ